MSKALITGGAGFIGSHLAEYHLARGDEVHCVDDLSTGTLENVAPFREFEGFRFDRAGDPRPVMLQRVSLNVCAIDREALIE